MARKPKEPSPNPSDIEYEVDKIVGHKVCGVADLYLIA